MPSAHETDKLAQENKKPGKGVGAEVAAFVFYKNFCQIAYGTEPSDMMAVRFAVLATDERPNADIPETEIMEKMSKYFGTLKTMHEYAAGEPEEEEAPRRRHEEAPERAPAERPARDEHRGERAVRGPDRRIVKFEVYEIGVPASKKATSEGPPAEISNEAMKAIIELERRDAERECRKAADEREAEALKRLGEHYDSQTRELEELKSEQAYLAGRVNSSGFDVKEKDKVIAALQTQYTQSQKKLKEQEELVAFMKNEREALVRAHAPERITPPAAQAAAKGGMLPPPSEMPEGVDEVPPKDRSLEETSSDLTKVWADTEKRIRAYMPKTNPKRAKAIQDYLEKQVAELKHCADIGDEESAMKYVADIDAFMAKQERLADEEAAVPTEKKSIEYAPDAEQRKMLNKDLSAFRELMKQMAKSHPEDDSDIQTLYGYDARISEALSTGKAIKTAELLRDGHIFLQEVWEKDWKKYCAEEAKEAGKAKKKPGYGARFWNYFKPTEKGKKKAGDTFDRGLSILGKPIRYAIEKRDERRARLAAQKKAETERPETVPQPESKLEPGRPILPPMPMPDLVEEPEEPVLTSEFSPETGKWEPVEQEPEQPVAEPVEDVSPEERANIPIGDYAPAQPASEKGQAGRDAFFEEAPATPPSRPAPQKPAEPIESKVEIKRAIIMDSKVRVPEGAKVEIKDSIIKEGEPTEKVEGSDREEFERELQELPGAAAMMKTLEDKRKAEEAETGKKTVPGLMESALKGALEAKTDKADTSKGRPPSTDPWDYVANAQGA